MQALRQQRYDANLGGGSGNRGIRGQQRPDVSVKMGSWKHLSDARLLYLPSGQQSSVHTGTDPEYMDRSYDQTLYPSAAESPMGLTTTIEREWDAAMRVRRVSPNAFAVLLGRVLDQICTDHQAEGRFLHTRIEHLASSGKLPETLKEVAHGLKDLRNFGAHGNLGDLNPNDAPLLESLCRALLMYLYTVPALSMDAKKRLGKA
jgi:hypothetical protein